MMSKDTRRSIWLTLLGVIFISGLSFILNNEDTPVVRAAFDNEPTRKAEIIIQSSKINANLTDFPVLLTKDNVPSEACDADGATPAQNGGGDIRFTSDENGNNQLPLEIVAFITANDPANCGVEMYVKVPSVSSAVNTSIWMWYNTATTDTQPSASSAYGSQNVWGSEYKGVWHLGESAGSRSDSTANANSLSDNNTVTSNTGKWGTAADFEGGNTEYLSITDNAALSVASDLTISGWAKLESTTGPDGSGHQTIVSKTQEQSGKISYSWDIKSGGYPSFTISPDGLETGGGLKYVNSTTALTTGTWYYLVGTYDAGSSMKLYINGSLDLQDTTNIPTSIHDNNSKFMVGAHDENGSSSIRMPFDGLLKDVRVAATVRSNDWISAEYENQNTPVAFAISQAPIDAASAPDSSTIVKSVDESVASSTTLQDDNHLVFPLETNTKYVVSGGVFATSTSGQPDVKIGFTVPSGSSMDIGYLAQGGSNRTAELLETSDGESGRIAIPSNGNAIIQPMGSVVTSSTAGNLVFKWAQFASNATSTTVKQGSFITVTKVTD